MKKFFVFLFALFLGSIFFLHTAPTVMAQSSYNAVLLLTSENQQAVVGNTVYYDLVLNTLGNEVNEIDVQFLVRGPFDRQSVTLNLHPEHSQRLHSSAPLKVVRYQSLYENEDGVRVQVVLRTSDGKPFNEGSAAIPVYRMGLRANASGDLRAYIDGSHSYVDYTDENKNDYDNYTSESRARVVSVISQASVTPSPYTPSPSSTPFRPTPTPYSSPSPSTTTTYPTSSPQVPVVSSIPSPSPMTKYDEEFARIQAELDALKNQNAEQEQRLSLVERIVASLRNCWSRLFR